MPAADSLSPEIPLESLRRRFELVEEAVAVGAHAYQLLRPHCTDDLLSEEDFERDGRIPYWVEIWPSSRLMAEWILAERGEKRRLLELGSGVGLVALASIDAGFEVVASDYYDDALTFCRINAERNHRAAPDTRMIDWRALPSDLGRFDVVAASDVLYDRALAPTVARVIHSTLAPNGVAWLTDPGRPGLQLFLDALPEQHLTAREVKSADIVDNGRTICVRLFEIRHAPVSA